MNADIAAALDYHERSKHRLSGYAAGPETLDWDAQPDPFRRFDGAPLTPLPLVADGLPTPWSTLGTPGAVAAQALRREGVAALLELSLALTAWKQSGPDRWALRANPSSGNLHPTEAYVLARGVAGVPDGLHHYQPREHALALRRPGLLDAAQAGDGPLLWLGLSSIHWREAWKYGERAFRYCQLDTGHALGAVRYAAAALGWTARLVQGIGHEALAALLGLDRDADFGSAEREEPELLLQIGTQTDHATTAPVWQQAGGWSGLANRLDARPMYRWPVIERVARATREPAGLPAAARPAVDRTPSASGAARAHEPAATLIRQRRSAQRFDRQAVLPLPALARMLAALQPQAGLPWDAWPHPPRVHAALWAHRVDGLPPGGYLLDRGAGRAPSWIAGGPAAPGDALPLAIAPGLTLHPIGHHPTLAATLRRLSCHQAIAAEACFAVSLLADFDLPGGWRYRERLQEAGLIGQVLYMQAEAEGYSGTGIGCYFDDAVHELLALRQVSLQVIYQFTVGRALHDERILSLPPYAGRDGMPPRSLLTGSSSEANQAPD